MGRNQVSAFMLRGEEDRLGELMWVAAGGMAAHNISDFLVRVLEYSQGNPGAIVAMLEMAKCPRYRSDDRIKITPLYIDFRLNWKPAGLR